MLSDIKNPNRCNRRTTSEKCLPLLMSAFAFIALIAFVSILELILLSNQSTEEPKTKTPTHKALPLTNFNIVATQHKDIADNSSRAICLSPECKHVAAAVLSKMKTEIEPCDDFYQFACGNFIDETQIPDDKSRINAFTMVADKLREQLKSILTEVKPDTEPKHFRLPNALYKACMNEVLIEKLGTKPIQKFAKALGGWPVVVGNSWNCNNTWSWQETVKKFRYFGFGTDQILSFAVAVDVKNNTRNIIELDQSSLVLSREYLINGFNDTLVSAYYDLMVDIAILTGAKRKDALKELKKSLQFEMELAKISLSNEQRRNVNDLYNLRSIKQIQETYPYVQWLDYINALLPENVKVDENEIINVAVPSFFEDLGKLLNRTDKRVIANYMMWRIYGFSAAFLTEDFRDRLMQYVTGLTGIQRQGARSKECIGMASSLTIAVGSLYVRKHFKRDSKAVGLEMVNNIREAFNKILNDLSWMDDANKREAKKKLLSMAAYIGYPNEMLNNDILEKFYSNLEIDPDKYFESYLNMNVFYTDYSFSQLRLPANKTDWKNHALPAVANAFYSPVENSIEIPAGILQGNFFNNKRPMYMNYGAIGYIIGHEITHGFDDQGRQFDANGNLVDWWQPDTQKAYLEMANCIIEQYGNYTDKQTGLNLNGIKTQGENIADNGGVKAAYMAYNQWVAKHGQESRLSDLNYSPQQMFWISYAQTRCGKYRTEYLKDVITTDDHSPDEFRILGSLRNMKDFSRDFHCPEGSPMNPVNKCKVW